MCIHVHSTRTYVGWGAGVVSTLLYSILQYSVIYVLYFLQHAQLASLHTYSTPPACWSASHPAPSGGLSAGVGGAVRRAPPVCPVPTPRALPTLPAVHAQL